ncbi:MAG: exported protein of unknown function [Candidatus Thorarchaeota archaeon]|nr:MAG: exported protein of unknown function [Candidatus Thorarchaeota archaeon]
MTQGSIRLLSKFLLVAAILLSSLAFTTTTVGQLTPVDFFTKTQEIDQEIYTPAELDSIHIVEYDTVTDALNALQSGNADIFGHRINQSDYSLVDTYSNIEKQWAYEDGIYLLAINCESSPLSNSAFRKALAYIINKTNIASDIMNDTVVKMDFLFGLNNEFSVEFEEGGEFYDSKISAAEEQLGVAGMLDVDEDGMIEAADGGEFQLRILYPSDVLGLNETATRISDDLFTIGINNTLILDTYTNIQSGISNHSTDYDLALYYQEIPTYGFNWTARTFDSDNLDVDGENIAHLSHDSVDLLSFQYGDIIESSQADELGLEAAYLLQNLNPVIPLFSYKWLSVYSDSNLEGWVNDTFGGSFGQWNPVTLTPKSSSDNELVVAVLPEYFDTFVPSLNPFKGGNVINHDWITGYFFNPYMLVYDSPLATLPDGSAAVRHSTSWLVQFLGQVSDISSYQTRASYYCDPSATWTDGSQITAHDYQFSFEYLVNNSLIFEPEMIDRVKVTGDYLAGIDYNTHHLFLDRVMGEIPILPRHIWDGRNASTWEPSANAAIGSGPFTFESFTSGSEMVLSRNQEYYPEIDDDAPNLISYSMNPTDPIPAETVSIKVIIEDRSRINNVTLHYTYRIGELNFTNSVETSRDATGFEGLIPARVTADSVVWSVSATDIWGNTAILVSGEYSRYSEPEPEPEFMSYLMIGGAVVIAIVAVVLLKKR